LSSRIALKRMPKVYCRPITVKCTVNPPKTTTQPHLPGAPDPCHRDRWCAWRQAWTQSCAKLNQTHIHTPISWAIITHPPSGGDSNRSRRASRRRLSKTDMSWVLMTVTPCGSLQLSLRVLARTADDQIVRD
jgi:hypothetical protein